MRVAVYIYLYIIILPCHWKLSDTVNAVCAKKDDSIWHNVINSNTKTTVQITMLSCSAIILAMHVKSTLINASLKFGS